MRHLQNSSLKNLLWATFIFPFRALIEHADKALIPNFTLLLLKFKPTIVIMHDLIEFNVPDKFSRKKMFYRTVLADPITAHRADHIVTVSENSKKDIMKFLGVKENKIAVVFNGVDQNKFHKIERCVALDIFCNRNWPEHFILYAGTIDHPGKNSISIVRAFEQLKKEKEYSGKLVLAGMPGSGYETIVEYINESPYKAEIILTGFVTDDELIALYSGCDVFCFVSLYEGFGIPPLEALACGARVIVSNTSSLPEVVGDVGIIVDPNRLDELIEGIKRVLGGAWKVSEQAVYDHLKHYNWVNLSAQFEKIMRDTR